MKAWNIVDKKLQLLKQIFIDDLAYYAGSMWKDFGAYFHYAFACEATPNYRPLTQRISLTHISTTAIQGLLICHLCS